MKIKYQLTPFDLYNANYYISWGSPEKRKQRILTITLPLLVILCLVFFDVWNENLINDKKQILWLNITFAFITAASIILTPFYIKSTTDNKINKFLRKDNNATILDLKELEIDENGIIEYNNDTEIRYQWKSIIKQREVNNYTYLYINPITIIILRRDMFCDDHQFQAVKRLIKENISQ